MKQLCTFLLALACLALLVRAEGAQRERLESARARWESLRPEEQALIQERWQRFQSLPEAERRELRARAERVAELRARAQRSLSPELRARVERLPAEQREQVLSELVEGESARIGARLRAALPPEVVQRLEQARPEDRARYFANYQQQQRRRVANYMIERLGQRLALPKEELARMKQLPEEQRTACVLELRQRLAQVEARELGLPPGLAQEQWEAWLALPPEEFFERLADHVRERQLAGAEAGIGRSGARTAEIPGQALARVRALRRLQQAAEADPADLVELAGAAPEVRAERVGERARQRCLRILVEDQLVGPDELERLQRLSGPAFAGAVNELLAPLRAQWRAPAEAPR
jgi:hypothetical protein